MLIQCPACHARTSLPDEKEGSKVRCVDCGRVHVARAAPPRVASRLDRGLWIAALVALVGLVYLLFERWYGVRQLGAIVLPLIVTMAAYVWLLPADLREVNALIPALQNTPLMTVHVSMAILAYATFAVAFAAAVLFLIANR